MIRRQVGVAHRHADVGMAKNLLQAQNVAAVHHEVTGERMPQDVRGLASREFYIGVLCRAPECSDAILE